MLARLLLESVEGGEQIGRYSFVGVHPKATLALRGKTVTRRASAIVTDRVLTDGEDILDVIKSELTPFQAGTYTRLAARLSGGAVGYLGYDCVRFLSGCPIRPKCARCLMHCSCWLIHWLFRPCAPSLDFVVQCTSRR